MKNPAPYIREKLISLLNEVVTYNGVQVPCYEGDGEVEADFQILLMGQLKRRQENRDTFMWRCEQRIEIISEQAFNNHTPVDTIGGAVMQILKPTVKTSPFTGNGDFQILNVNIEIENYIDEPAEEKRFINRLPLTLTFIATQINSN